MAQDQVLLAESCSVSKPTSVLRQLGHSRGLPLAAVRRAGLQKLVLDENVQSM